jgi:hypothetical protein
MYRSRTKQDRDHLEVKSRRIVHWMRNLNLARIKERNAAVHHDVCSLDLVYPKSPDTNNSEYESHVNPKEILYYRLFTPKTELPVQL